MSHANPEDNPFARWLSLKLAALGYNVWSDVTKLLGGEDFWQEIEAIIRNSAVKFWYVLSHTSNHREGVLRELRVANAVQKKTGDLNDFIIPIRIDGLPHGETKYRNRPPERHRVRRQLGVRIEAALSEVRSRWGSSKPVRRPGCRPTVVGA